LLPLFLLLGVLGLLLFGTQPPHQQPVAVWWQLLGGALLGWCLLGFGRVVLYVGQQGMANGWDEAREEDLARRIRRGRRSQQVLSVSLHTALREGEEPATTQLEALLNGARYLKSQPSRLDSTRLCRSRLSDDTTDPELALLRVLMLVLADLSPTLAQLPDDKELALLLEIDGSFPEAQSRQVWQQAWSESGIRQSIVPVEGRGLDAVDQWLDQRITDQALLLVVALQFAPEQPEGTAEVAVGLLLGNRLTQTTLAPIAYLHRPEQERGPTTEALLYAACQALDWVPLEAKSIEQVWRVGIDPHREVAIASVLVDTAMPFKPDQGLCNLDALLGHPGEASPWLAIAAATQTFQRGTGPQFIFSGGSGVEAGLWCSVLMPVPALSK